jgi:adenylate cyclase
VNRLSLKRLRKRIAAALIIAVLGIVWGIMLWQLNMGRGLRAAAYDLPFLAESHQPPGDIVMITIDEASHEELQQPLAQPWDRKLHARMIDELTESGAKIIVFDILFHDEDPESDAVLAAAIRRHGKVVLAGELVRKNRTEGAEINRLLLANPTLRRAAAGWGLAYLPIDPDGVARRIQHAIPTPFGLKPSLSEMVRSKLQGGEMQSNPHPEFINHYGVAGTFPSYSYSGVLARRSIPDGAFRDKIVIIGAKQNAGLSDAGKDMFATPYFPIAIKDVLGRKSRQLTPGMEIHATLMGNLMEGRRIREMDSRFEIYPIVGCALLFAAVTCLLTPLRGVSLALLIAALIAAGGIHLQMRENYHFVWTLPVMGQMPFVVGLSLAAHYFIEYSARWKLRGAFKSYMSDEQARQIDEDDVSLELGGKEVEATILFSDLAGFTSMSEGLPPQAVSKALISYFERATEGILDNQGTIIKYVGDAVMATWGAPLKVDREADRAIDAAIQMQIASSRPITLESADGIVEQVLETRIGINTGLGLAGNLGSSRRFDYSIIGDTTNTAARLEGLNKMLGTSILVAESVLKKCMEPERFTKRRMGSYVLKGRRQSLTVYEILGYSDSSAALIRPRSAAYLDAYAEALEAFERGDFGSAIPLLGACSTQHDRLSSDPAAGLMLKAIEAAKDQPGPWTGHIVLDSK